MDLNLFILRYGNKIFKIDAEDDSGVYMCVDGYTIHIRQDDATLATGLELSEIHPLISRLQKAS